MVGGQAINFWAEVYAPTTPELAAYGPFTSKDVDFYCFRRAASELADQLNGTIALPSFDDHTPSSAVIYAEINGYNVTIDFLGNILGVSRSRQEDYSTLRVDLDEDQVFGNLSHFTINVMSPLNCIISRVNTIINPAIARRDEFAFRQIWAVYYIFRQYVIDLLKNNRTKEAHLSMRYLTEFLTTDPLGIRSHLGTPVDFLKILEELQGCPAMDQRYREKTLAGMIRRVEQKRAKVRFTS